MPSPQFFIHTVSVLQKTTANVQGGAVVTYSPYSSFTNIAALVTDQSGDMKVFYEQRQLQITHQVYFNQAVTCVTGDVLQFGSRLFFIFAPLDIINDGTICQFSCSEIVNTTAIVIEDK